MKVITKLIVVTAVGALAAGILLAQGNGPVSNDWRRYTKPYDPKTPPPLTLPDAYALTLSYMGNATNRFYCVSASCLEKTIAGLPGWMFRFSDTNGQSVRIEVHFDRDIYTDNAGALGVK